MYFGILIRKKVFNYILKGKLFKIVDYYLYLGVEFSDNLKYNLYIDNICKKVLVCWDI